MLRNDKILPLHAAQSPFLALIHQECFEKPWEETFFATLLSEEQTTCPVVGWLAVKDEQPAGFILARNQITQTEILTFSVRPCFQKQGIGACLLEHLQNNTSSPILLEVAVDNQAAISLYQRHKFEIIGNRPHYYDNCQGAPTSAHVMRYRA